jgi:hypothetical protein
MSAHWRLSWKRRRIPCKGELDATQMSEGSFASPVAPFHSSCITSQSLLDLLEFWPSFLLYLSSGYSINSVPPSSNRAFKPSEGQPLFAGVVRAWSNSLKHMTGFKRMQDVFKRLIYAQAACMYVSASRIPVSVSCLSLYNRRTLTVSFPKIQTFQRFLTFSACGDDTILVCPLN